MNVNDRVTITTDFLGVQWTKGRTGTIVRQRRGVRGTVNAVHIDNTSWNLDFDDEELEHLHTWVYLPAEQRGWIAYDNCTTCDEIQPHEVGVPHAIRERNGTGFLDMAGNDIDFTSK